MVHIVVDAGVYPTAQPITVEAFGVQFPAKVTIHIIHNHKQKEEWQVKLMNGYCKQKDHYNTNFYDGFQRVKGISGPGRWVYAFVMHQVKPPEQGRMVHEAMGKVKIQVVQEEHEYKSEPEIGFTVLINVGIKGSIWPDKRAADKEKWYQGKYADGECTEKDFAQQVGIAGHPLLYFSVQNATL
jgi:hypothetical protein